MVMATTAYYTRCAVGTDLVKDFTHQSHGVGKFSKNDAGSTLPL